jgi:hypothetical protein
MKQLFKKGLLFLSLFLVCFTGNVAAQNFDNAGDYLGYVNDKSAKLTATYLAYLSAVSHGKSARKVEKRRAEVVAAIVNTRSDIAGMPVWKADRSLKDTTVAYLKILFSVFNEDYGKIVNMEEIAEQSYDAMEAYMLAQDKAYEKLNDAGNRQHEMQKTFAKKYNINLIETETELGNKSKIVKDVMDHCNAAYLIFFKCYKQEVYLMEAIEKKNLVSVEQSINSLGKFAEEGIQKLKTLKGYNGDASLIAACKNMMDYYKAEAKKGPTISEFFLKEEEFTKAKKLFESKPSAKRTQQDVDQYNNAVNAMNNAANSFNATMNDVNKQGKEALNNWNKTYSKYMDEHMPKQSKQ